MLMDFQGIFPMNKHEIQSNFVRFGIYFNRKLCLKFVLTIGFSLKILILVT